MANTSGDLVTAGMLGKAGVNPQYLCTIMRLSRRHSSLQVVRCNREMLEREECEQERIRRVLVELLKPLPITFGQDPRGYTVKVHLRGGECNTMGGRENGWGIA